MKNSELYDAIDNILQAKKNGQGAKDLYKKFRENIENVIGIENQIVIFLEKNLNRETWISGYEYVLDSMMYIQSNSYIPYLVKIMKSEKKNTPYLEVLNVLKNLNDDWIEEVINAFYDILLFNNKNWGEPEWNETFGALFWVAGEKKEICEFVKLCCNQEKKPLDRYAKDWSYTFVYEEE